MSGGLLLEMVLEALFVGGEGVGGRLGGWWWWWRHGEVDGGDVEIDGGDGRVVDRGDCTLEN